MAASSTSAHRIGIAVLGTALLGLQASAATVVASRSNPVAPGTIIIDGTFIDWAGIDAYPSDQVGEVPPGDQDWSGLRIAHDADRVYLRVARAEGSVGFSAPVVPGGTTGGLGYWVVLDTDLKASTGLRSAGGRTFSIGGEYNFGGSLVLNRWSITGSFAGEVPFTRTVSGREMEISILRSDLGNPASFHMVLVGETSADSYPDGAQTTEAFEYVVYTPEPVPTGEVASRSNAVQAGSIVIDGIMADWDGVEPYPEDAAGDGAGSQDWLQAWVAHDENTFYIRLQRAPSSIAFTSPGYWALYDTDVNPDTGLTGFGQRPFSIGAEFNTSGAGILNGWSAAGCHTGGASVVSALSADARNLEMAIPRAQLGGRSRFRLVFAGENSGDYYPDGGNGTAWFGYSMSPCHRPFADAEGDTDVDADDFTAFQACMTGALDPLGVFKAQACACFDRDDDQDVDQADFGIFQRCYSGRGHAADPACEQEPRRPLAPIEQFVTVPAVPRELPEALPPGGTPGFAIRGTKGWNWDPEQYLAEVPVLARYKMNFLMNCYLSLYKVQGGNRWWVPIPSGPKAAYEQVIAACQAAGVHFCFCMNPQLSSPDPLDPTSDSDFELLWQHYDWAQSRGVTWFCLALDDISGVPIVGAQHAALNNRLLARLREQDPQAQLIFCPTWYWGNGSEGRSYLDALGAALHPDVYVFWTGDSVVPTQITVAAATSYRQVVNHRLILWDNYPVNDGAQTLHLGPVVGRPPDLAGVLDGYMSNPLYPQSEINRIPLITIADYAYNPWAYDPLRSIGQTVYHLGETEEQRLVLKDIVEAYPGMLFSGCSSFSTGFNPVRQRYLRLAARGSVGEILAYVEHIEGIAQRLTILFPGQFTRAAATVSADAAWMRQLSGL